MIKPSVIQITQPELKEILEYNEETGEFTWLVAKGNRVRVGQIAGSLNKGHGYIEIGIDNKLHYAHRLVWLYHFGNLPDEQIDHINGDRANNRVENLRESSRYMNARNQKKSSINSSGTTGVSLRKTKQRNGNIIESWVASWYDSSGKQLSKSFSVPKYTFEQAKKLAINYREERIQELNVLGFGYTTRHGMPQDIMGVLE